MPQVYHGIQVRGIKDLQKALRQINEDLPKELATANQHVAQHVVTKARARAAGLGRMEARAAESLAAARQQRIAAIRYGGARYPMAMGAEFGAAQNTLRQTARGVMRGWNQFRPWRGSDSNAGYILFPTLRAESDQIVDLYGDVLGQLTRKHFPQ
jgi:hypothetical protein